MTFKPEVVMWEWRDGSVHAEMMLASFFDGNDLVTHLDGSSHLLKSACGKSYFAVGHASGLGDPARENCTDCRALITGLRMTPELQDPGVPIAEKERSHG
jgi:hypothetical protein